MARRKRLKLDSPVPHLCPGAFCAMCRYQVRRMAPAKSQAKASADARAHSLEMWRKRRAASTETKGESAGDSRG